MSYTTFHARIKSLLEEITELQNVYGYVESETSGFPYACILVTDSSDSFLDTTSNERVYTFEVMIVDDLASAKDTHENVSTRIRSLADLVLDKFDSANFADLGGFFHLISIPGFSYLQRESGKVLTFRLRIQIRKQVGI